MTGVVTCLVYDWSYGCLWVCFYTGPLLLPPTPTSPSTPALTVNDSKLKFTAHTSEHLLQYEVLRPVNFAQEHYIMECVLIHMSMQVMLVSAMLAACSSA